MSKQIPIQLQSHYDGYATTTCQLVRILRKDGVAYGLTDADHDIRYNAAPASPGAPGDDIGELLHLSGSFGANVSKLEAASDLSVNNGEILMVPNEDITTEMVMNGDFDGAQVWIYRVNYMDLSQGHELVDYGLADVANINGGKSILAFRSQSDLLKEPEAVLWSKTCDITFGDPEKCPKAFDWVTGTVTAVDADEPDRIFGSSISPANDYYKFGVIHFLSGPNAGEEMEVDQNTGGSFALALPLRRSLSAGDTFKIRQSCNKVYNDPSFGCLYHWGAVERNTYFGGHPDIPSGDSGSSMVPGNGLTRDDD